MKIVYITDVIYPFIIGGSEMRNYEVAKRLVKKGHEVHIFGAKLWEGKKIIEIDGIILHGVSRYDILLGKAGIRSSFDPIILAGAIFKEIVKYDFDIIDTLAFTFLNCYSMKLVSKIKGIPLVLTWQQHFGDYLIGFAGRFHGNVAKFLEKHTINITKHNIAASEIVKEDLIKEGMNTNNCTVIPNGADIKTISKIKNEKKIYDLIFVGRLTYQKNPELLIKLFRELKKKFPKIKLCIIGDGNRKDVLLRMVKKYQLEKNVVFKGKIIDRNLIFKNLKASKIFVLPSIFEGFPLTSIEANACGLPIVTADYEMNRTKSFIKGNGIVAKPDDMAKAIESLLKNKKQREIMGKQGMKMAEDFDWDIIAGQTESYYKQVIENHKQ